MTPIEIPWKTYYFYKNRLSARDRSIYDAIFNGVCRFEKQIPLPVACTLDEVLQIHSYVRRDCPLLFHLGRRVTVRQGTPTIFYPEYLMDYKNYLRLQKTVKQFVYFSVRRLDGLQLYQQVKSIHNSMARHVIYHGTEEESSHNVLGAILYRRAVCESIALAFKLICDGNRIPCIAVYGRSSSTDGQRFGASVPSGEDNHAWNRVKIGENWYNVDVTFDLGIEDPTDSKSIKYGYFCRSDAVFSLDHTPSFPALPPCTEDHSYYRSIGMYVTTQKQLKKMVAAQVKARDAQFTFEYSADSGLDGQNILSLISNALRFTPYRSFTTWHRENLRIMSVLLSTQPLS